MRYPINTAALGVMIEQLFGEPAAVVIAGTEEKNGFHLQVTTRMRCASLSDT